MSAEYAGGGVADAELNRRVKKRQCVVISNIAGGKPDLEKCTCKRTLCPDGTLLEVVRLDGSKDWLDVAEFQQWVDETPVSELKK